MTTRMISFIQGTEGTDVDGEGTGGKKQPNTEGTLQR